MSRRKEIEIGFADGLGFGFTMEVFQVSRIGQRFPAGGVLGIDGVRQIVYQRAQEGAFPAQRLFHLLVFCDIATDADESGNLALRVAQNHFGR